MNRDISRYRNYGECYNDCDTSITSIKVICNCPPPPVTTNININNTIFVDAQYGNDLTGLRETLNLPFQTISAALLVALPEDLIYVWPGDYSLTTLLIAQNQNFFFNLGAIVTSTGHMFNIASGITLNVAGEGEFNTPSGFSQIYIPLGAVNTIVNFEGFKTTGSSTLVTNNGDSKININIDYIYMVNDGTTRIITNELGHLDLYLKFVESISNTVLLYSSVESTGRIIINGEYLEVGNIDSINIIDVQSPDIIVKIEINETLIKSNAQLLNVNIINEILTRVYFKGDSVTTVAKLLYSSNVLNGNVILEIANISANVPNDLRFIECIESVVQIDNENFEQVVENSIHTTIDVRNKSKFSMKSSRVKLTTVQLLLNSLSLEDDCEISLDIKYFESGSSLFNLRGNVTCSAKFDKIVILNQLTSVTRVRDGVLLYFDCDDISIITDSLMQVDIFENYNSQTYFNLDKIYANVKLQSLLLYTNSTYSSFKSDNMEIVTDNNNMLYSLTSNVDVEIGELQINDNKTIFYIQESEANIEVNSTLNISSRLLQSNNSTVSMRLNDVNTSFYNLITSDFNRSVHVYFNSIVYTGISVVDSVFILSNEGVNLYFEGNLLNLGKIDTGVLTSADSVFRANIKKVLYDNLGGSGFTAQNTSKMYLEFGEYDVGIIDDAVVGFTIRDTAYISVGITRMTLQGNNTLGFNIIDSGTLDSRVKYCTSNGVIIQSTTLETVSYHTKDSVVSNNYMFVVTNNATCRYVLGGYMTSLTNELMNVLGVLTLTPRIAFLSSTIVCAVRIINTIIIGLIVQMEPSISNVTAVGVTIIPIGVLFVNVLVF